MLCCFKFKKINNCINQLKKYFQFDKLKKFFATIEPTVHLPKVELILKKKKKKKWEKN